MKSILVILISLLASSFNGWLTDFDQAKNEAMQKNRYILLNFSGSDWCVPCIKQKKEIFETNAFKSFADSNLVLLNADFPRSSKNKLSQKQVLHNEKLAEKYNPSGKFPFTILLTADGKILKEWNEMPGITATAFIKQIELVGAAGN